MLQNTLQLNLDIIYGRILGVCFGNPHCSASSIYSVPIDQRAHEAQEGEEGGEVGVHGLSCGFQVAFEIG